MLDGRRHPIRLADVRSTQLARRLPGITRPAQRTLKADDVDDLSSIRELQNVAAGETFLVEGEPAINVFTVAAGIVKLFKLLADGRRQIVGFLVPGEVVGLVPGDAYLVSAQAVNAAVLWRFPRRQLERLFAHSPGTERQFLDRMAHELVQARDQIMLLGRKTAHERVASFLLTLAQRQSNGDGSVDLPMTRTDIGDFLGLTMETVSRVLTALKGTGCIAMTGATKIRIVDVDMLAELAEGQSDSDS